MHQEFFKHIMWLINTGTLERQFFLLPSLPPYAILSHTWGDEECSFEQWTGASLNDTGRGYTKIRRFCDKARSEGWSFAWVDTVCIDKTSSAELSEAINSMSSWYQNSSVCYVYLADVRSTATRGEFNSDSDFYKSRWFTRGWTLIELIAPEVIQFFDGDWNFCGTKKSLSYHVSDITGIPSSCLKGLTVAGDYSIADKMAWASRRSTTRVEDIAYCLMGLFDVYIPVLYGEGKRAFLRLQQEILVRTTDQSLLAWRPSIQDQSLQIYPSPIWAESPAYFPSWRQPNRSWPVDDFRPGTLKYRLMARTNIGMIMWAPVIQTLGDLAFAALDFENSSHTWMPLLRTGPQSYHRVNYPSVTVFMPESISNLAITPSKLYLQDMPRTSRKNLDEVYHYRFNVIKSPNMYGKDHSTQEPDPTFEVITAFLDENPPISKSSTHRYPPIPLDEENVFGMLRLDLRESGYLHGIIVFEHDSTFQNESTAIFFAAFVRDRAIRSITCRILVGPDDCSPASLEATSKAELHKICSDENVPQGSLAFESSIWRHRDQRGNTAVDLHPYDSQDRVIATITFNAQSRVGNSSVASSHLTELFEESKETTCVVDPSAS